MVNFEEANMEMLNSEAPKIKNFCFYKNVHNFYRKKISPPAAKNSKENVFSSAHSKNKNLKSHYCFLFIYLQTLFWRERRLITRNLVNNDDCQSLFKKIKTSQKSRTSLNM